MKFSFRMKSLAMLSGAAACMMSGCSFYLTDLLHDSPNSANNGFRYMKADSDRRNFSVDQQKNNFKFNEQYYILDEHNNPDDAIVGRQIDITAPIQILDTIPGSVSNMKNNIAILTVNTSEYGNDNYDNVLWEQFLHYLKQHHVPIEKVDSLNSVIQTGWFSVDVNFNPITPKMLADNEDIEEYRLKYEVAIKSEPEQHKVRMAVALTNFKIYHQGDRLYADPDSFVQSKYSSLLMNDFILSLHHENGINDNDVKLSYTGYITARMGKDKNGQYAWIVNANFETVWNRFVKMLPECGFDVKLSEKTRGLIDVKYSEPDEEYFEQNGIDNYVIEDDKYRFQLGIENGETIITIFDNLKQPLNDNLFLKMYPGFARTIELEFNK